MLAEREKMSKLKLARSIDFTEEEKQQQKM